MVSPKSVALPVVEIVKKSMVLKLRGESYPPANNALVPLASDAVIFLTNDKSPKSVEFPVVAIVIKSTLFVSALAGFSLPAWINPLVAFEDADGALKSTDRSPKSCVFPRVCIVTNCIVLTPFGAELSPLLYPQQKYLSLENYNH